MRFHPRMPTTRSAFRAVNRAMAALKMLRRRERRRRFQQHDGVVGAAVSFLRDLNAMACSTTLADVAVSLASSAGRRKGASAPCRVARLDLRTIGRDDHARGRVERPPPPSPCSRPGTGPRLCAGFLPGRPFSRPRCVMRNRTDGVDVMFAAGGKAHYNHRKALQNKVNLRRIG